VSANAYAKAVSNGQANANATGLSYQRLGVSTVRADAIGGNQAASAVARGEGRSAHVSAYSSAGAAASSKAEAFALEQGSAHAESVSTGANGERVATSASAPLVGMYARAATGTNVGGAAGTLPTDADSTLSTATVSPDQAAVAALFAGAPIAAAAFADTRIVGAGTMVGLRGASQPAGYSGITTANFQFDTTANGYLKLGLLDGIAYQAWSSGQAPVGQLELTISNHGTEVFSRSFGTLDAAVAFFNDRTLYLGELAAGHQDLLVTADFTMHNDGAFGFQYALGVSPVPEPQTWLLMLLGATIVMVSKRRRA
jgi:hypothetical protein